MHQYEEELEMKTQSESDYQEWEIIGHCLTSFRNINPENYELEEPEPDKVKKSSYPYKRGRINMTVSDLDNTGDNDDEDYVPSTAKKKFKEFSLKNLKKSSVKHLKIENTKCEICNHIAESPRSLTLHKKTHRTCDTCGKDFWGKYSKRDHAYHSKKCGNTPKPTTCQTCKKVFKYPCQLNSHLEANNPCGKGRIGVNNPLPSISPQHIMRQNEAFLEELFD